MVQFSQLPDFLDRVPQANTGIPGVRARVIRGTVLCVLFEFAAEVHVPEHSHGAQFGTVVAGRVKMRRAGRMHHLEAGTSYLVQAGEPHEAWIDEGTILIELFEDVDRY